MAGFCAKCGAPTPFSSGFCSACGARIESAPAAAPPAPGAPPPPAYPVAYPATSSGGALKVILIVVAVVVGLGVIGMGIIGFGAWRLSRGLHVNDNGNGVTVSVPGGGTISAGDSAGNDADLGVPLYPGAVRQKGGVQMKSASASMAMANFATDDAAAPVVDFYKSKLGPNAVVVSSPDGTVLSLAESEHEKITITIAPGSGQDSGKTMIMILHAKKGL
jgi:hypothetical protein